MTTWKRRAMQFGLVLAMAVAQALTTRRFAGADGMDSWCSTNCDLVAVCKGYYPGSSCAYVGCVGENHVWYPYLIYCGGNQE